MYEQIEYQLQYDHDDREELLIEIDVNDEIRVYLDIV